MLILIFNCLNINILLTLILCIIFVFVIYCHKIYTFWSSIGVNGPKPIWIFGNTWDRFFATKTLVEFDMNFYKNHGGSKFCGFYEFTQPALMVGDPELLKHIMIKDFEHFTDRSFLVFNNEVMDEMLLGLKGGIWKKVRSVMTPIFTSSKMKQSFSLVMDCSNTMLKKIDAHLKCGKDELEMKSVFGRLTMDTINSIAFGVGMDSQSSQNEFSMAASQFFKTGSKWKRYIFPYQLFFPRLFKFMGINFLDATPINFFSKVVSETMKTRLKNGIRRNDFLQLLLDASVAEFNLAERNKRESDDHAQSDDRILTEDLITAQCIMFYIAGYETTATTLSFAALLLALHADVQSRLTDEVDSALDGLDLENISYDVIHSMTYLDMVVSETLRLFPPLLRVDRSCTKDFLVPDSDIVIKKGVKIIIPIYSIHRDERHYKDPDVFDPDRFSAENKRLRPHTVYLPFGAGPRNCIGVRYALMEVKVSLVRILKNFSFAPSAKTTLPVRFSKASGMLKTTEGIWVKLVRRTRL